MTENERQEMLKDIKDGYIDAWDNFVIDELFEQIEREHEEIQQYRAIGTSEGYESAIQSSIEYYNRMKEYKSKLQDFEEIGTIKEFKALKDAEKQGLILKLPVAEGTNVFCIGSCGELCDDFDTDCEVCGEHEVVFCVNFDRNMVEQFGKTVFITEEEAEQALAKRQDK